MTFPLAAAHLAALDFSNRAAGCEAINVGTGRGITVKELVQAYERACGEPIAFEIAPRRAGDVASSGSAVASRDALSGTLPVGVRWVFGCIERL